MPTLLHSIRPAYAVILGGTNDLGRHSSTEHILSNIIELHRLALSTVIGPHSAINTIPVTIPSIRWPVNETSRVEINKAIRLFNNFCLNSRVIDLSDLWTNASDSMYWSPDFVHFSEKGYDKIGEKIFDTLHNWIEDDKKPVINLADKSNSSNGDFIHSSQEVAINILKKLRVNDAFSSKMC